MTEKIKSISNPLTIIAIFAALAEINATISIGLIDKELQYIFIWFVIFFPTLLVLLFFLTLNFNTKVIYSPSDYRDENIFYKTVIGKPDKEINTDKNIIRKTFEELGINKEGDKTGSFKVSEDVNYLFSARYNIEKEIRRLSSIYLKSDKPGVIQLANLIENDILTPIQGKAIRNIYSIATPAIHGDDHMLTAAEIKFVKEIAPGLIEELRKKK